MSLVIDEKNIDADKAAGHRRREGVIGDDGQNGDRTQTVDVRPILRGRLRNAVGRRSVHGFGLSLDRIAGKPRPLGL
jgi:hypothetical protein